MKKQSKLTIKARLIQGAFLLGIAFLFNDVIPSMLGQGDASYQPSTHVRSQWVWQNPLSQGNGLFGLSFTDANNGTAVGLSGSIVRTTDGGRHWINQSSGTSNWLYGVSFVDGSNGTVVGANGTILRTTDGGNSWDGKARPVGQPTHFSAFPLPILITEPRLGIMGQSSEQTMAELTGQAK